MDTVHQAGSQESGKVQLDWSCAYKAKAGILQNETVWGNAAKMPPEQVHWSRGMKLDVREALAPRVGQSGDARSVSSHFSFVV